MSVPRSQSVPPSPAPCPPCPQACSLRLCLYSCPASRLICTIFADSCMKVLKCNFTLLVFYYYITNYHRLSSWKQLSFTISQLWRSGPWVGSAGLCLGSHKVEIKMPTGLASHLGALGKNLPSSSCRLLAEHNSLWNYGWGCMDEVLFPCQPLAGGLPSAPQSCLSPFSHGPFQLQSSSCVWSPSHNSSLPDFPSAISQRKLSASEARLMRSGPLR